MEGPRLAYVAVAGPGEGDEVLVGRAEPAGAPSVKEAVGVYDDTGILNGILVGHDRRRLPRGSDITRLPDREIHATAARHELARSAQDLREDVEVHSSFWNRTTRFVFVPLAPLLTPQQFAVFVNF